MLESSSSFSSLVFHSFCFVIIVISAVSRVCWWIVVNFHEIVHAFFLVSLKWNRPLTTRSLSLFTSSSPLLTTAQNRYDEFCVCHFSSVLQLHTQYLGICWPWKIHFGMFLPQSVLWLTRVLRSNSRRYQAEKNIVSRMNTVFDISHSFVVESFFNINWSRYVYFSSSQFFFQHVRWPDELVSVTIVHEMNESMSDRFCGAFKFLHFRSPFRFHLLFHSRLVWLQTLLFHCEILLSLLFLNFHQHVLFCYLHYGAHIFRPCPRFLPYSWFFRQIDWTCFTFFFHFFIHFLHTHDGWFHPLDLPPNYVSNKHKLLSDESFLSNFPFFSSDLWSAAKMSLFK